MTGFRQIDLPKMTLLIMIAVHWTAIQTTATCPAQQPAPQPEIYIPFDGTINPTTSSSNASFKGSLEFSNGLVDQCISMTDVQKPNLLNIDFKDLKLNKSQDFSIEFWVRTDMPSDQRAVLMSTKPMKDGSIQSQRGQGWCFFVSSGTWGWNMGSGNRRISYDRTNGEYFRINDGRWHQLAMTHDSKAGLVRLYFDGRNLVTYNIKDSGSFEFGNDNPIQIGWDGQAESRPAWEIPAFTSGAAILQEMVNEYEQIGLPDLRSEDFQALVSRPSRLIQTKTRELAGQNNPDQTVLDRAASYDTTKIESLSKRLMRSPYTVHQSSYYNEVARLFKLYSLNNGTISINRHVAEQYAQQQVLKHPRFQLDELKIWNRKLSSDDLANSYSRFFQPKTAPLPRKRNSLVAGSWNIYHGGLHQSVEKEGWDSRQAIIDLLKREDIDVLMMQETYSSGDYIAAELGYYFATTIDWDNMFQGANISVLSKYPIEEIYVPPKSTFMSVAAKVSLSQTQNAYVMSSWFGMRNFDDVFEFHKARFDQSDQIPTLFAGDFNAVPHTDGGNSPASERLLEYGFQDAFRTLYPNVQKFPGSTHRSNRRIDQIYFKGKGLQLKSTEVFSHWPSKFPSDHYLIRSEFKLSNDPGKDTP